MRDQVGLKTEIIEGKHRLQTTAMLTLGYAMEVSQGTILKLSISSCLFLTDAEWI